MAATKSNSRNKKSQADAVTNEAKSPATQASVATTKESTNMSEASIIEFSEDISNAEAPAPLPVGDYPAEIRGAERKTSAKGNPYGSVTFFIAPENYPADFVEGDPDGMTLLYNRVTLDDSPQGRYRMRKFCEAIGAPMGSKVDLNDWVGLTATVSIGHDTYEGETRAVINKVNAA